MVMLTAVNTAASCRRRFMFLGRWLRDFISIKSALVVILLVGGTAHGGVSGQPELSSTPMRLFMGRVLQVEPKEVGKNGGQVTISYANYCTEHFENLVFSVLPRIDPEEPATYAVGAIMSGSRCEQCRCPLEVHEIQRNLTADAEYHPLVVVAPQIKYDASLFPARILDLHQEPISPNELEVTVTYLETCDTLLLDVIPVKVSPIGGYHQQVGVLALASHNPQPCPMPSHPKSQKFHYPSSPGGYTFLPVEAGE
jgi:hypothetical protein